MQERLRELYPELTKREIEIATGIAKGKTNREIAQSYGLQLQSVKNLASLVMAKLKCANRVQVALLCRGIDPTTD
jgi:DNA-binding NarL/FixJ family response regulator